MPVEEEIIASYPAQDYYTNNKPIKYGACSTCLGCAIIKAPIHFSTDDRINYNATLAYVFKWKITF